MSCFRGIDTSFTKLDFVSDNKLGNTRLRYNIVVFPAASRPTIRIRMSVKVSRGMASNKPCLLRANCRTNFAS